MFAFFPFKHKKWKGNLMCLLHFNIRACCVATVINEITCLLIKILHFSLSYIFTSVFHLCYAYLYNFSSKNSVYVSKNLFVICFFRHYLFNINKKKKQIFILCVWEWTFRDYGMKKYFFESWIFNHIL